MLGFLDVEGAQAFLTDAGRDWYTADILHSKELFAASALRHAPLVRTIVKALENSDDGTLKDGFFHDILRRGYSAEETDRQLETAINWGRYGEPFDYDSDEATFILAEVAAGAAAYLGHQGNGADDDGATDHRAEGQP